MMYPERKTRLFYWFDKKGVERLTGVKLLEITDKGLSLDDQGRREALPRGRQRGHARCRSQANQDLEDALQGKVPEVYSIGDCDEPGPHPRRHRGGLEDRERYLDGAPRRDREECGHG